MAEGICGVELDVVVLPIFVWFAVTHDKSAMALAERVICSRWLSRSDMMNGLTVLHKYSNSF